MRDTTLETLINNIKNDISTCSSNELNKIYEAIRFALKKFDKDSFFKNSIDFFKLIFKTKRNKCLLFIEDIIDSKDKLTAVEKEELRITFLNISNIHRTFIENIIALLEAL